MSTLTTTAKVTSTALLLAMSALASAATPPANSTGRALGADDTVHCYGVNSCKGSADCKTTAHECKGMNSCKGQGFKAMEAGKCLSRGGVIGDLG